MRMFLPALVAATLAVTAAHAAVKMNTFDESASTKAHAEVVAKAKAEGKPVPVVQHGNAWNAAASGLDAAWDKAAHVVESAKGTMKRNAIKTAEADLKAAKADNDEAAIKEAAARLAAAKAEAAQAQARAQAYNQSAEKNWEATGTYTKAAMKPIGKPAPIPGFDTK